MITHIHTGRAIFEANALAPDGVPLPHGPDLAWFPTTGSQAVVAVWRGWSAVGVVGAATSRAGREVVRVGRRRRMAGDDDEDLRAGRRRWSVR